MVARSELSAAELQVWDAFPRGEMVSLGGADLDPHAMSEADGQDPSWEVRAEVIIELLSGAFSAVAGRVPALRLSARGSWGASPSRTRRSGSPCSYGQSRRQGAEHRRDDDRANMYCGDGFRAEGETRMLGVRVGGRLRFDGAHLANPGGNALTADQMVVTEGMYCQDGFQAEGGISLYRTSIGVLCDDPGSWPRRLVLDGFTYEGLYPYLPAGRRLTWLRRMDDYRAQPYEQLAAYYRRLGHDEQARRVLLARMRARTSERPWLARSWGWFQDVLAGYGYAPGRAVGWLVGVFMVGWVFFQLHRPAPAKPQDHPVFHAALYALDLMLPAPALGQEQAWDPQGGALAVATGLRIFGWVLAIAVVAGITRALSRS
jgi:hypothetical protein